MKPCLSRSTLAGLALLALPLMAAAQTSACETALQNAAYTLGANPDEARLSCDIDRAAGIRDRARQIYGLRFDSMVEIIDTASPSGAAYVYNVLADDGKLTLDARSVPDGKGPRCRLQVPLAEDKANELTTLLSSASDPSVPGYGPREDVTINPDGSRSVRLVFDSHDIITRAETAVGARNFSRHSGSDDPVSRLNNLVIGIANVSPGWVCNAS
ncbi:hypothetical protein [Hyphomonas sp.]|uniref:hypothetical protein n=1 Tax=Hyphomonas sp. TaxID=87 RepID=UPI00391DAF08